MKVLMQLLLAGVFICASGWYVIYKTNPHKICTHHPDKDKQGKYLRCLPGIDFPMNSFIDGRSPIERERLLRELREGSR
jgi:hypothetical protein